MSLPYAPQISAIAKASELAGGKAALALKLNVKPPTVQQWANGKRPVPAEQCVAIYRLTHGEVPLSALHKKWREIWPAGIQLEELAQ
jgi:DNA-binding transcriptional regulator YdaS (Cro superfamily)